MWFCENSLIQWHWALEIGIFRMQLNNISSLTICTGKICVYFNFFIIHYHFERVMCILEWPLKIIFFICFIIILMVINDYSIYFCCSVLCVNCFDLVGYIILENAVVCCVAWVGKLLLSYLNLKYKTLMKSE